MPRAAQTDAVHRARGKVAQGKVLIYSYGDENVPGPSISRTWVITNSSQSQAEAAEPRSCEEASAQCVLVETTRRTTNCSLASAVFTWIAATPKPGLDFPLPADDGSKEISAADRTKLQQLSVKCPAIPQWQHFREGNRRSPRLTRRRKAETRTSRKQPSAKRRKKLRGGRGGRGGDARLKQARQEHAERNREKVLSSSAYPTRAVEPTRSTRHGGRTNRTLEFVTSHLELSHEKK